jgi:hypothetical protein
MRLTRTTSRRWLPVLAALAVALLGVGAAVLVAGLRAGGGAHPAAGGAAKVPPTLRLAGLPSPELSGSTGGRPIPVGRGGTSFRLAAPLPAGPSSATAYRLAPQQATAPMVTRLVRALGLTGSPRRVGAGWVVTSGGSRLVVLDGSGLPWSYATAAAGCLPPVPAGGKSDGSVSSGSVSSCAVVGSDAKPSATPAGGIDARAKAILGRLGAPTEAVRRLGTTFTAATIVAGQPVLGLDAIVDIAQVTGLKTASGYLASPVRLAEYPLIPAREAFARLAAQPTPQLAIADRCLEMRGRPGCRVTTNVITNVRLGLETAVTRDSGLVLVPSWLFTLRDNAEWSPVGVIAIADRYLNGGAETSAPTPGPPAGGSGPGMGAGS